MAGRIPQQFIDDLTARVDIVDVIDARVPLRKAGRDYSARCPFHDEKTPSFTVSQEKQFYHCFGCGAHGTAIGFLMEFDHMEFVEAVHDLASRVGMEVPETRVASDESRAHNQEIYSTLQQAADFFKRQLREHHKGEEAIDYLKARGISGETAAAFGMGYAPPGWDNLVPALGKPMQASLLAAGMLIKKEGGSHYDRFRDRIMFPIRDPRGRVIAFGGRVLGDDTPKYLNSPETPVFHKGRELYGLYEARKAVRHLERLLVVEGYMDVIMLAQHDIHYAVATLGTATTTVNVERLLRLVPEVVFCFDGDRAGREAAWRALENTLPVMREGYQARFLFLPEGEDPDSQVQKEEKAAFEKRIGTAITLSAFFYDHLQQQVDTGSIDGRARLVELARPYLAKLPQGVFRHMMTEHLATLAKMDAHALGSMLGGGRDSRGGGRRPGNAGRPKHQQMSLVRHAIFLLLHRPQLAKIAGDPARFQALELRGASFLVELLELLLANPHFNTASLLEHWRQDSNGPYLARLAQQELLISTDEMTQEFEGVLKRMDLQRIELRIQALNDKARTSWSEGEKAELQQLFREKSSVL